MKDEKQQNDSEVADILGTLADLDRGMFAISCGRKLLELNRAVAEVRAPGTLTITLKIKPAGFSDATGKVNQCEIQPAIDIKKPEHPLRKSLFFLTEDARLSRQDPDQLDMFEEREIQHADGKQ